MNKDTRPPLERARALLAIHKTSCSVRVDSVHYQGFLTMALAGEVTLTPSGTLGYMDVYVKGFQSRFEKEPR